jgi:hypothetical protein
MPRVVRFGRADARAVLQARLYPPTDTQRDSREETRMSTAGDARPRWSAPPNWPSPPAGWSPPPAWQPDPSWPPPPSGHRFWQPKHQHRRWRTLGIVAASLIVLVPTIGFAAMLVATVFFDVPIDLPPGDVYSLTISNDTRQPVEAFMCDDKTCTRGVEPETIRPRHHNLGSFNEDQYSPSPVGLADPVTHQLLGCITPPSTNSYSRPLATTTVLVSSMHPCARHSERAHPVVIFYDPIPG